MSMEVGEIGRGEVAFERLTLTIEDGVAGLDFNDAVRGNPIDAQFCAELSEAAVLLSSNPAVRAVLMTASGDAFGYGGDIKSFLDNLPGLSADIKRWTTDFHSAVARLQRMDPPIVVAVHGVCAGGMSALVAGADIVIAAQTSRFAAAYAGIGFSCDGGSSIMYARRMGAARARRFLLLNETLDAETALDCGLVDEVHFDTDYRTRAEQVAQRLAAGPTKAFGEMRRLFLSVFDQPLEAQLEAEAQALSRCAATRDAQGALSAFGDRRTATFEGA